MLTPKQLQEIVETMQPLLDGLNVWITKDIIKRVMARLGRGEDLELTSTDVWQAQVYRDLGGHYEALQRQLMAFTEAAEDEIRHIFQYTGLTAYDADAQMYHQGGLDVPPLRQSPRILQVLEDTYRRTNGEIRNFTRTTATATQQRLIQALDKAHIMVMSGATSYATAVKEIVDELAGHQAFVRYPTGHTDTLEVAVLRAVRTGTAQASGNMSIATMEQYGWEIVLTSAHLGARYGDGGQNPGNHFWWQGRFFSRTGKDTRFPPFIESTGYGTGEGLCGWNCRHSFGPGDGVHNPWMKYDAEENKRAYDLSQMQRKKERDIRSQTKKVEAFKEAVEAAQSDDVRKAMQEALKDEQGKLTNLRKDYGNFCDENDLKRQAFRLQVAKAKQQEAERAYYSQPATGNSLTGSGNSGTMEARGDEHMSGIHSPIEQRNTGKGNPNAMEHFGRPLNNRQQRLDDALQEYNSKVTVSKKAVNLKDIAALTAKTNVEYAVFTRKSERMVIRGAPDHVYITPEMAQSMAADGWRWSGHTHPGQGPNVKIASQGDVDVLKAFGQEYSVILDSTGKYEIFGGEQYE